MGTLQLVRGDAARLSGKIKCEGPCPPRRTEATVGRGNLEARRLVAGVRRECQTLEDEVDVDRVVRQARESVALIDGDRTPCGGLEERVLLGAVALDRAL